MVLSGSSILGAGRALDIRSTTAKKIMRRYRKDGSFYESARMKSEREAVEKREKEKAKKI
jgi:hypothetical protein